MLYFTLKTLVYSLWMLGQQGPNLSLSSHPKIRVMWDVAHKQLHMSYKST